MDSFYMERALLLGEKGRLTTPPNPWVGSVIVKDGKIIGEGFHKKAGDLHAEVIALNSAGSSAENATLYCTLEPCSHVGRQPPCIEAIIRSKIARCVIGIEDPDPLVQNKGVLALRKSGIQVDIGQHQEKVALSLKPYLHHRRTNLPYTILKAGISMDGKLAYKDGTSKWITSKEARANAHLLRAESQAILIGSGTAIKDKPQLTARDVVAEGAKNPVRVLLDSRGTVPYDSPLFDQTEAKTLVLTTEKCPKEYRLCLEEKKVETITLPPGKNGLGVDLKEAMKLLGKRGFLQLVVEGGPQIHTAFLEAGLANQITLYVGPRLLGATGKSFFTEEKSPHGLQEKEPFSLLHTQTFGNSVRIDYEIIHK